MLIKHVMQLRWCFNHMRGRSRSPHSVSRNQHSQQQHGASQHLTQKPQPYGLQGPRPKKFTGVWWTKCQIILPMGRSLHSSIFVDSIISFWSAAQIHQLTIQPEPFFSLAPATKHASWGPKLVANMPAPHGHHVSINFGSLFFAFAAAMNSTFLIACMACSSPG